MTALDVIANAVARLVSAEEALEVGDIGEAFTLLVDLEADLVGSLAGFALGAGVVNRARVFIRGSDPDTGSDQYAAWVHEPSLERELGVTLDWGREKTFVPWTSVVRIDFDECECVRCRSRAA